MWSELCTRRAWGKRALLGRRRVVRQRLLRAQPKEAAQQQPQAHSKAQLLQAQLRTMHAMLQSRCQHQAPSGEGAAKSVVAKTNQLGSCGPRRVKAWAAPVLSSALNRSATAPVRAAAWTCSSACRNECTRCFDILQS